MGWRMGQTAQEDREQKVGSTQNKAMDFGIMADDLMFGFIFMYLVKIFV